MWDSDRYSRKNKQKTWVVQLVAVGLRYLAGFPVAEVLWVVIAVWSR